MTQNSAVASSDKPAGLATRLISALLGGGLTYLAVTHFFAALPMAALIATALVALVGLIAPKWLLLPIAAPAVVGYRLGKRLSKEAYSGLIRGIFNGLLGLASSIAASVATATYLGWANDLTVLIWFPASCIAFVATLFIIEPAAFLYILKPTGDGLEKLWKWTGETAKKHAKPFFQGLVNITKLLPGSSRLWAWVENKEKGAQWVDGFMGVVTGVGVLALTGTTAYAVFHLVAPYAALLGASWLITSATWFAAGVTAIAMVGVLFQLLDKGELPFAATAITGTGVYAALPLTKLLGFGLLGTIGVSAALFVVGLAYIYPAIHGLLKTGFIKAILDGIRELVKNTYDEKDADFRKFFAHVVTPVCALISGGIAFAALAFYGLPLVVILPVALVCAAISYLSVGEAFDDFPTTIASGLVLSLATGFGLWYFFSEGVSAYILWPSLVVSVAFTFTVVLTLIYQGFRFLTISIAKLAGETLGGLHKKAYTAARDLTKWWDKTVIAKTYEEKSKYSEAFLHTFNAAVLGVGIWQALPLVSGWLGLPGWAIIAGLVASGLIVYLILGRILLSVGVTAVGIAVGLGTFASITWSLYQLAPAQWWLAASVASAFTSVAFYVVTPLVLLVIKGLTGWFVTPVCGTVLGGIYTWSWGHFEVVWDAFISVAKVLNTWILQPIIKLAVGFVNMVVDAWNSVFGRK